MYAPTGNFLDIGAAEKRLGKAISSVQDGIPQYLRDRCHANIGELGFADYERKVTNTSNIVLPSSCHCVAGLLDNRCQHCREALQNSPYDNVMAIDSVYYPGVFDELVYHCANRGARGFLVFNDYDAAIQKHGHGGQTLGNESRWSTDGIYVTSTVDGNLQPYSHRIVQTGGLKAWQLIHRIPKIGRDDIIRDSAFMEEEEVLVTFKVLEEFVNKTVPYRLVQVLAIKTEELRPFGQENGLGGVRMFDTFFRENLITKLTTEAETNVLKNTLANSTELLKFVESYSKRKVNKGTETFDFYRRQQDSASHMPRFQALYDQIKGRSNFKVYETKSKVATKEKMSFINLEVYRQKWWSLGMRVSKRNYCAPFVTVMDLYLRIGNKDDPKQITNMVSNYTLDRPETAFCAMEAATIAYYLKSAEFARLKDSQQIMALPK
jgi:hypothetical protein